MTLVPSRRFHSPQTYTNMCTRSKKMHLYILEKKYFCKGKKENCFLVVLWSNEKIIWNIPSNWSDLVRVHNYTTVATLSGRTWCLRPPAMWLGLRENASGNPWSQPPSSAFRPKCPTKPPNQMPILLSPGTRSISSCYTVQHPRHPESFPWVPRWGTHYPL